MSRSVTLDRARWESQRQRLASFLRKRQEAVERVADEATREAARSASAALAMRSFPFKYGVHLAKISIKSDLNDVYITAGRVYGILIETCSLTLAKSFYASYKRGDIATAREILQRSNTWLGDLEIASLDPYLHNRSRTGKHGRVMLKHPLQLVPQAELDQYMEKVLSHMGRGAAGWSACALQLGGESGVPSYKSTDLHGSGGGFVTPILSPGRVGYVLHNTVPYARRLISGSQIRHIMEEARTNLANRLQESAGLRDAA